MLRFARTLTVPLYAVRVFTGSKTFNDPILGHEKLNRRGLHVWRTVLAHRMSDMRRRRLEHLVSEVDRAAFAQDGFVMKPHLLPPDTYRELVDQLMRLEAPAREMRASSIAVLSAPSRVSGSPWAGRSRAAP